MLAIAISCLFGLAACAALVVIHSSLVAGAGRAKQILVELAKIDRQPRVTRTAAAPHRLLPASLPALAAA